MGDPGRPASIRNAPTEKRNENRRRIDRKKQNAANCREEQQRSLIQSQFYKNNFI